MPKKLHQQIATGLRGVDFSSTDLERKSGYLKDALNMELGEDKSLRGRLGYERALSGAFNNVFQYTRYNKRADTYVDETVVYNGELFILKSYDIYVESAVPGFGLTLDIGGSANLNIITIEANGASETFYLDSIFLGDLLLKLVADPSVGGATITNNMSEAFSCGSSNFNRVGFTNTIDFTRVTHANVDAALDSTYVSPTVDNKIQIFSTYCKYARAYKPCVVLNATGAPLSSYKVGVTGGYFNLYPNSTEQFAAPTPATTLASSTYGINYWWGFASYLATCIHSCEWDSFRGRYVLGCWYLAPVRSVSLQTKSYVGWNPNDTVSMGRMSQELFGDVDKFSDARSVATAVTASDSLFIANPTLPRLPIKPVSSKVRASSLDCFGRPVKYDGYRADRAGLIAPSAGENLTDVAGGTLGPGTYEYAVVLKKKDAVGRVIYSDPTYVEHTVFGSGRSITFHLDAPAYYEDGFNGMDMNWCVPHSGPTSGSTTEILPRYLHVCKPDDTLYCIHGINPLSSGVLLLDTTTVSTHQVLSTPDEDEHTSGKVVLKTAAAINQNDLFSINCSMIIARRDPVSVLFYIIKEYPWYIGGLFWSGGSIFTDTGNFITTEPLEIPELGRERTQPPACTGIAQKDGRLIYLGKNEVYYSLPDAGTESLEYVPRTNSISISGGSGGATLTAVATADTSIYVFRERGISRIYGNMEDETGGPAFAQVTMTEGDFGADCPASITSVGGVLVVKAGNDIYGVFDGQIFPEVGKAIRGYLVQNANGFCGSLYYDHTSKQLLIAMSADDSVSSGVPICADFKGFSGNLTQESTVIFSREAFSGAFFPWEFKTPNAILTFAGIIDPRDGVRNVAIIGKPGWASLNQYPTSRSGLFLRNKFDVSSSLSDFEKGRKYLDVDQSIKYVVNYSPIFGEVIDQVKSFKSLKFWRFLSKSAAEADARETAWTGALDLYYNFSNVYQTTAAQVVSGTVAFADHKDTQMVVDISGADVLAVEPKITVESAGTAPNISSLFVDMYSTYDVEDLERSSNE